MTVYGIALIAVATMFGLGATAGKTFAGGPFDGTYVGRQTEVKNDNSGHCNIRNRTDAQVTVSNGVVTYMWETPFAATVNADGIFRADRAALSRHNALPQSMVGRIEGATMTVDIGNNNCMAHSTLTKR